jgi:hypothetical protein
MSKSKKQKEFEEINALADTYKKFTDEQLLHVINGTPILRNSKYRQAVKNELKKRGIHFD